MEQLKIKVNRQEKENAIKSHELFKWVLIKEEKIDTDKFFLYFERDSNLANIETIKKHENEYFKVSNVNGVLIIILPIISILYLTVFAILFMSKTLVLDEILRILLLIIPPAILMFTSYLLSKKRTSDLIKYIDNAKERYLQYKEIMEGLDSGN